MKIAKANTPIETADTIAEARIRRENRQSRNFLIGAGLYAASLVISVAWLSHDIYKFNNTPKV